MFLLIPLAIIFASALAISAIVWRKRSSLKEMITAGGNAPDFTLNSHFSLLEYSTEFFPELSELVRKIKINKYKSIGLIEAEKSLRKVRLVFLKIDRLSDTLIKKIRKVHVNGQLKGHLTENKLDLDKSSVTIISTNGSRQDISERKTISVNFLKNEEQRLILEIAKNPKDARLYELLGDLYMEMENFADAKESYEAVEELNPQKNLVKEKLSSALEKINSKN